MIPEVTGAVFLGLAAGGLVLYFRFPGVVLEGAKKLLRRQAGLKEGLRP